MGPVGGGAGRQGGKEGPPAGPAAWGTPKQTSGSHARPEFLISLWLLCSLDVAACVHSVAAGEASRSCGKDRWNAGNEPG